MRMDDITKLQAKHALGIDSDTALGNWFNDKPTKQAVGKWGDDEPLPPARQWELRARRPDLFGKPAPEQPKAA